MHWKKDKFHVNYMMPLEAHRGNYIICSKISMKIFFEKKFNPDFI